MGRFSEWARTTVEAKGFDAGFGSAPRPAERTYFVDNSRLKSSASGLQYRRSMQFDDRDETRRSAQWGSTVIGSLSPEDPNWLQVGRRFLPTHVHGQQVLFPFSCGDPEVRDDADMDKRGNLPEWMFSREPEAPRVREAAATRHPSLEEVADVADCQPGRGALHVVAAARAVVRRQPSTSALAENYLERGRIVELFDFDTSRGWRRCLEANATRPGQPGWMLLCHPEHGQLLRPLEPICVASARGDIRRLSRLLRTVRLQGWSGASGCHPVNLAVQSGLLEACAVLARSGASFDAVFDKGCIFPWRLSADESKELVAGMSGRNFDVQEFERALTKLPAAKREEAERMFDQAAEMINRMRVAYNGDAESDHSGEECDGIDDDPYALAPEPAPEAVAPKPPTADPGVETIEPSVPGVAYRVVYSGGVFVRSGPSADSESIGMRHSGDIVELFEFDTTRRWRRIFMGTGHAVNEPRRPGWVLLQHSALGVLLEPYESAPAVMSESDHESDDDAPTDGWAALLGRR